MVIPVNRIRTARRYFVVAGILLVVVVTFTAVVARHRPQPYSFHYENVLGTSMDLTVLAPSEQTAQAAEAAVLGQIDHDAKILSGYDPDSEFSRWSRTIDQATPVSPELFEVLGLFDKWREQTGGAVDAAAEAVSRLWQSASAQDRMPSDEELAAVVRDIRQPHWKLDAVARTATHLDATPLVLNSFTKSYIVDRAAHAALTSGPVRGVVVNIGGDLVARGEWTEPVSLTDPQDNADNGTPMAQFSVRNRAVATSGGYRRGFDIAGHHYSHIVDPRTGQPTSHVLSATVVANVAADAGALATAFCVLAPEDSVQLASRVPGTEFLMVLADGSRIASRGWRTLETVPPSPSIEVPSPIAQVYASEQTWNPAFELTVSLEIARPRGMGKRPYVAVWIEDKDRFPLRTLALWFEKPRYLAELRLWDRDDRLRAMADGTNIIGSVSSATRSPGSYTLKWDGKDQRAKFVKPGTYTILIEAAREHGTYQLMRHDMDLSGVAQHVDLPGGVEIASASLDYHVVLGR